MTRGKNADSLMPKNHLIAMRPLKFVTATTINVQNPKLNIMQGRTLEGPYFLPSIPRKGAVNT